MHPKKIVLVGFMGSGKSAVGPMLAQQMGWAFVDMDERIVEHSHRESIADIFQHEGEAAFRQQECDIAKSLEHAHHTVIATGGGVVMDALNVHHLKTNGLMVWLDTSLETVKTRIGDDHQRPLLQQHDLTQLYAARQVMYAECADWVISTDEQNALAVTLEILERLKALDSQKEPAIGR